MRSHFLGLRRGCRQVLAIRHTSSCRVCYALHRPTDGQTDRQTDTDRRYEYAYMTVVAASPVPVKEDH